MAAPNQQIYLDLLLWDFDPNKFVLAKIYSDGVELDYSPLAVPHLEDGYYFLENPLVVFPEGADSLTINYEVYRDSNFTIRSNRHAPYSQEYTRTNLVEGISEGVFDELASFISDTVSSVVEASISLFLRVGAEVNIIPEEEISLSIEPEGSTETFALEVEEPQSLEIEVISSDQVDLLIEGDDNITLDV